MLREHRVLDVEEHHLARPVVRLQGPTRAVDGQAAARQRHSDSGWHTWVVAKCARSEQW